MLNLSDLISWGPTEVFSHRLLLNYFINWLSSPSPQTASLHLCKMIVNNSMAHQYVYHSTKYIFIVIIIIKLYSLFNYNIKSEFDI